MATRVRLFISGGPDQEPARELLGRALAELPINVGWVIKRTPDIDSVAECHLFLLLMGSDIWAPVGWELYWALRTEKPILAFRADALRTPAGLVFLQENARLNWSGFTDLPALRRLALKHLGRFLLDASGRYGLTLPEIESLAGFLSGLEKAPPSPASGSRPSRGGPTGAAGGGVILAPGKDQPPGARPLGEA